MVVRRCLKDDATRSQSSRYGKLSTETKVAQTSHRGHNNSKDLCEHTRGIGDPKGEDMELVMGMSHREAKELAVSRMDVHVEVHILHIESHEPSPRDKEGMIWGKVTIRKQNL